MVASFQRFFEGGEGTAQKREEASGGKEELTSIPKSANKPENKQNIISDVNLKIKEGNG